MGEGREGENNFTSHQRLNFSSLQTGYLNKVSPFTTPQIEDSLLALDWCSDLSVDNADLFVVE